MSSPKRLEDGNTAKFVFPKPKRSSSRSTDSGAFSERSASRFSSSSGADRDFYAQRTESGQFFGRGSSFRKAASFGGSSSASSGFFSSGESDVSTDWRRRDETAPARRPTDGGDGRYVPPGRREKPQIVPSIPLKEVEKDQEQLLATTKKVKAWGTPATSMPRPKEPEAKPSISIASAKLQPTKEEGAEEVDLTLADRKWSLPQKNDPEIAATETVMVWGKSITRTVLVASAKKVAKSRLILLVGEGSFKFTEAFVTRRVKGIGIKGGKADPKFGKRVIATEYKSRAACLDDVSGLLDRELRLKSLGVTVLYGIDGTQIHKRFSERTFQRIQWNCPDLNEPFFSGSGNLPRAINKFAHSASQLQEEGGKLHITLVAGQGPAHRSYQADHYHIVEAMVGTRYYLQTVKQAGETRYKGYEHQKTFGQASVGAAKAGQHEYIFIKSAEPLEQNISTVKEHFRKDTGSGEYFANRVEDGVSSESEEEPEVERSKSAGEGLPSAGSEQQARRAQSENIASPGGTYSATASSSKSASPDSGFKGSKNSSDDSGK